MVPAPETTKQDGKPKKSFLEWIVDHDDKRLFVMSYVGLTLLLTIGISMFWLIFLVTVHFFFEIVKKQHDGAGEVSRILAWAAWDIKFDIALISMALVLIAFTEISFGIAGIAGLGRFSIIMSRFSGATRGILPIKDMILGFRIVVARKMDRRDYLQRKLLWNKEREQEGISAMRQAERMRLAAHRYPWQMKWSLTSKFIIGVTVANLLAVLIAILFGQTPYSEWSGPVFREFHPWPR